MFENHGGIERRKNSIAVTRKNVQIQKKNPLVTRDSMWTKTIIGIGFNIILFPENF